MLEYVGNGAYLQGVPARDLSEAEAAEFDRQTLIASGVYVERPEVIDATVPTADETNLRRPRTRRE